MSKHGRSAYQRHSIPLAVVEKLASEGPLWVTEPARPPHLQSGGRGCPMQAREEGWDGTFSPLAQEEPAQAHRSSNWRKERLGVVGVRHYTTVAQSLVLTVTSEAARGDCPCPCPLGPCSWQQPAASPSHTQLQTEPTLFCPQSQVATRNAQIAILALHSPHRECCHCCLALCLDPAPTALTRSLAVARRRSSIPFALASRQDDDPRRG